MTAVLGAAEHEQFSLRTQYDAAWGEFCDWLYGHHPIQVSGRARQYSQFQIPYVAVYNGVETAEGKNALKDSWDAAFKATRHYIDATTPPGWLIVWRVFPCPSDEADYSHMVVRMRLHFLDPILISFGKESVRYVQF